MSEHNGDLMRTIIRDEIAGKNQAIHAYDKMVWTIRTGFLTLFFAGWGLILSSVADAMVTGTEAGIEKAWPLLLTMLTVSTGLTIAGYVVDLNYVRRKFRVIAALNGLLAVLIEHEQEGLENRAIAVERLRPYLAVSGDSGDGGFKEVRGYEGARNVSGVIFSLPLLTVAVSLMLLAALA